MAKRSSKNPQFSELHIFRLEEGANVKVTMTKIAAGPQGVARPGRVLDVKEEEGKALFAVTAARPYDAELDKKAKRGWVKAKTDEK